MDEVICYVVPVEASRMVLDIPYLYDRKAIFFREHNQYHLTKEGTKYVMHAHDIKGNQSIFTMEQLRKATYSSKNVTPKLDDLKHEINMVVLLLHKSSSKRL